VIEPSKVSAVLVTKGDHDLTPIYDSISAAGITDVVVWDNSQRPADLACYGRYAGIAEAKNDVIFHQDDDLIAPVAQMLEEYDPVADRDTIVANNRADEEWLLTGIGTLFHRDLADCFDEYISLYGFDAEFCRVSDVVFAYQHPYRRVVMPYTDLAWAATPDRMHLQPNHYSERGVAKLRAISLRYAFKPALGVAV